VTDDDISGRIERAISDVLTDLGETGMLVDWVVVTHQLHLGAPGEEDRSSTGFFASEEQPSYRTLGLLDFGRTSVIKEIHDDMDGDDL
jgi:hypothetical protein